MPRSSPEPIPHEEHPDEDRDREGYVGRNSTHAEDSTDSYTPSEDKEQEEDSNSCVKPYGVHRRKRMLINPLHPEACRETIISRIRKGDAGRGDHATLAHEETADDSEAEDCEGGVLRHHLDQVGCPWLA